MSENDIDLTKDTRQNVRRLRTRITNRKIFDRYRAYIWSKLSYTFAFSFSLHFNTKSHVQMASEIENELEYHSNS